MCSIIFSVIHGLSLQSDEDLGSEYMFIVSSFFHCIFVLTKNKDNIIVVVWYLGSCSLGVFVVYTHKKT